MIGAAPRGIPRGARAAERLAAGRWIGRPRAGAGETIAASFPASDPPPGPARLRSRSPRQRRRALEPGGGGGVHLGHHGPVDDEAVTALVEQAAGSGRPPATRARAGRTPPALRRTRSGSITSTLRIHGCWTKLVGPTGTSRDDVLEQRPAGVLVVHVHLDLHLARAARDPPHRLHLGVVDAHDVARERPSRVDRRLNSSTTPATPQGSRTSAPTAYQPSNTMKTPGGCRSGTAGRQSRSGREDRGARHGREHPAAQLAQQHERRGQVGEVADRGLEARAPSRAA